MLFWSFLLSHCGWACEIRIPPVENGGFCKHPMIHGLSAFNQPFGGWSDFAFTQWLRLVWVGFRRMESAQVTSGSSSSIYTAKSSGRLSLAGRRAKNVRLLGRVKNSKTSGSCNFLINRPGKHTKNYWTRPFSLLIYILNMVIFHSYVGLPEGI